MLSSPKLLLVLITAALLIALPVLPLRFLGIPGPDFGPDGFQIADLGRLLFGARQPEAPVAPSIHEKAARPAAPRPITQVKLLEQAAQELQTQIGRAPQDPALQNRLGLIYISLGEMDKAATYFEQAVELCRVGLSVLGEKGEALQAQGKASEASEALLESSRLNVELSAAHSNLAKIYERLGQHDRVVAELEQLNREGGIADSRTAVPPVISAIHKLSPAVARLLARGEAYKAARRFPEAIQEFRNVIAVDPELPLAHREVGLLLAITNHPLEAADELETALRLEPADAPTHNNLALTYEALGRTDQAQVELEKALALDPALTDAAINLGNLHSARQNYKAAQLAFEQAIMNSPRSAVAHNNLGSVLSLQGSYNRAIEEFRKAIVLNPSLASAHYGLGLALFNSKSYQASIKEFKQALTLDPSLISAHQKIEQAYRRAGLANGSAFGFN